MDHNAWSWLFELDRNLDLFPNPGRVFDLLLSGAQVEKKRLGGWQKRTKEEETRTCVIVGKLIFTYIYIY